MDVEICGHEMPMILIQINVHIISIMITIDINITYNTSLILIDVMTIHVTVIWFVFQYIILYNINTTILYFSTNLLAES